MKYDPPVSQMELYANIIPDITTQLKTWKHEIWQHEHYESN
jgi:hypothetical protein